MCVLISEKMFLLFSYYCELFYLGAGVGLSVVLKSMHRVSLSPYSGSASHFIRSGQAKPYCLISGAHPALARSQTDLKLMKNIAFYLSLTIY